MTYEITICELLIYINISEVEALCRILEPHYINYEDREAHEIVNKLFRLKREYESRNDMDRTDSQVKE